VTIARSARLGDAAVDAVRSALIADIVAGELLGPLTPSRVRQLAARYNTSSGGLRMAMQGLPELGLLTDAGAQMHTSGHDSWRLFAPSVFPVLNQQRGHEAIAAYWEARRCVDPALSALAAQRRSAADIAEISRARGSLAAARQTSTNPNRGLREFLTSDDRLREAIAQAARNRYLARISARLRHCTRDADWVAEQALLCAETASCLETLTDAILDGNSGQAARAAQAELAVLGRLTWRRLDEIERRA
jgi:DNA-binding FadR family transcriptional regulator